MEVKGFPTCFLHPTNP